MDRRERAVAQDMDGFAQARSDVAQEPGGASRARGEVCCNPLNGSPRLWRPIVIPTYRTRNPYVSVHA